MERLAEGPVIFAVGYLFELERRGYLRVGAFAPEPVLENPRWSSNCTATSPMPALT